MVSEEELNSTFIPETDSDITDIKIIQPIDEINSSKFSLNLNTIDVSSINDINTSTSTNHLTTAT